MLPQGQHKQNQQVVTNLPNRAIAGNFSQPRLGTCPQYRSLADHYRPREGEAALTSARKKIRRAGGVSPLMTHRIRGLTPPARRAFANLPCRSNIDQVMGVIGSNADLASPPSSRQVSTREDDRIPQVSRIIHFGISLGR